MDSLLNQDTDIIEWLNILIRNPETAEQDLSALSIKLQLIEQDLELNLDYESYSAHTIVQSLKSEVDSIQHQTLELLQESQEIAKTLSSLFTPEITQLQQDHHTLAVISNSKTALKEIDHLDFKLSKALEVTKSNTNEAVVLVRSLFMILDKIDQIPAYAHYKEKIAEVIESFDQTLTDLCSEACNGPNLQQLIKVKSGFESFKNVGKFNELVFVFRLEGVSCKEFECSVEGFEDLTDVVAREIKVFKEVIDEPEELLSRFVHSLLVKIRFMQEFRFLSQALQESVFSEFLKFCKMIKDSLGSLRCLEDFFEVFAGLLEIEKKVLKAKQQTFVRPVTLNSWIQDSLDLIKGLDASWTQSLTFTFATCGFDWEKIAEDVISEQLKVLNTNYSEITNVPLELSGQESKFKFQWSHSNKFVWVFEGILLVYNSLEELSVKCRNSFLHSMTTSYFSPEMEIHKEIQAALMKKSEIIMKNNAGLIGFLREGGVFFAKSLESIEKELEICKGYTEKILMGCVLPEINAYSDLDLFKTPDSLFSVSPSSEIIKCGEHILEILQFLTPKNEDLYAKAFQVLYSVRPPNDLPHSIALHFWVMAFVSRFLKTIVLRISKIQGITQQGKKQLLADVEYVYNIVLTLGLFKQEEIAFGQNLVVLRQRLISGQVDDLSKVKNYS